ncbi:MAG: hypothetical protein ABJH05_03185 [Fulvivirga sp.]
MNKYLFKAFALGGLILFSMSSCQEEDGNAIEYTPGNALMISGSSSAKVGESKEYYLNNNLKDADYNWSIGSGATITENSENDAYITVQFDAAGEYTLSVTKGDASGEMSIKVETQPAVTVEYNGTGVLMDGETDTVFFEFTTPLSGAPDFAVNTDSSGFKSKELAFTSGTLGTLVQVDADSYYALYTAGAGNGTPEALFQDITANETYGSINVDSAFVQLYRVDNTAPIAELSYSESMVNDSTVLTVTATFSEEVMFEDPADSALLVMFSGGGVMNETDTLVATDDPLVYTYDYTVNGEGNGTLNVTLDNIVDLAGHEIAATINSSAVVIDNTDPNILIASANDAGETVEVSMTASEASLGYYLLLADGADAPTTMADFDGASSFALSPSGGETIAVDAGEYDVYFIAVDGAGNASAISMVDLTVN